MNNKIGDLQLPELKVVSAENPRQLEKRFGFLWSSAIRLLQINAALAHHASATMMQLAKANQAQLPQPVLDYICEHCAGNRRLARKQQRTQQQNGSGAPRIVREALTTIVRVTCHRCKHSNDRPGASVVHKAKTKKRSREEDETVNPVAKKLKTETVETQDTEISEPVSMFAPPPPPSPPRKLLDGPKKRKKKKKTTQPDAAATTVKSSLSSFLQGLRK